jgi:curved DNA-binding protein
MTAKRATSLTIRLASAVLGVPRDADAATVRRAFRQQAMRLHPDRHGGDAAKFREMLEAYRLIQAVRSLEQRRREAEELLKAPPPVYPAPAVRPEPLFRPTIEIDPTEAMLGGARETELASGRKIRIELPAGLRPGELLRAGGETFRITVKPEGDTVVRGSDLWITAKVDANVLRAGGRVALTTPIGRRIVWISKKAGERRLVRLEGQGLPARGEEPAGHLFLRLVPEAERAESRARTLLRRFAEAWAA